MNRNKVKWRGKKWQHQKDKKDNFYDTEKILQIGIGVAQKFSNITGSWRLHFLDTWN